MSRARAFLLGLAPLGVCGLFPIVVTTAAVPRQMSAVPAADPRAATAVQHFLHGMTTARQYSGSRRLEASGRGHEAWLDVETDFTMESGLVYRVTAEGGSGYIRSRVLRSLLDAEKTLIARGRSAEVAISSANYTFAPEGIDEQGLAVVGIRPLRKERSLILGRMFLTADGAPVRVEGRLAKTPSFWVTNVEVVREYRTINGVPMPVSLETKAQLRFLGSSELRMTYRYEEVDQHVVSDESPDYVIDETPDYVGDEPVE